MQLGPVILDIKGLELTAEEAEILQHPLVGGIIFFSRNYDNPEQIAQLTRNIRQQAKKPILITVDQEGGRVQRFQRGLTRLPPMGMLGSYYETHPDEALILTENCGWILAAELLALGIDLSFTPVVDLDKGKNTAIGNRSFHFQPDIVIALASALVKGMETAGMMATIKHFPGHGSVNLDSHLTLPVDERDFATTAADDLIPFEKLIAQGIKSVMTSHILFPQVDQHAATFSKKWLTQILRKQLHFSGLIVSDDLNMAGAEQAGAPVERAQMALEAGCDMILMCNNPSGAREILNQLPNNFWVSEEKYRMLQRKEISSFATLHSSDAWQQRQKNINDFQHRYKFESKTLL